MGFRGKRQPILVTAVAFVTSLPLLAPAPVGGAIPYDIVYVRQPRFGDNTNTTWPEVAA